jgi:hypothetical protein
MDRGGGLSAHRRDSNPKRENSGSRAENTLLSQAGYSPTRAW